MMTYCIISMAFMCLLRSALHSTKAFRCFREKCQSVSLASLLYCWLFYLKAQQNGT